MDSKFIGKYVGFLGEISERFPAECKHHIKVTLYRDSQTYGGTMFVWKCKKSSV